MCLDILFRGKRKSKELAKLPDMVTCWKVVNRKGNQYSSKYIAEYRYYSFLAGWNNTMPRQSLYFKYKIAFHAFLTKQVAYKWRSYKNSCIVKCKTKKKDIVAIGEQSTKLCIVTKRIWIPKPKKKKIA